MKKALIGLGAAVGVCTLPAVAGGPVFQEGFEPYGTGTQLPDISTWEAWDNDPGAAAFFASTAQAHSGTKSVAINGLDDAVHQFDGLGLTSGVWAFEAWQFVPTSMNDSQFFILLNDYTAGAAETKNWSTQLESDGDANVFRDADSGAEVPLVKGQWALIRVVIDLENDGQSAFYDGNFVFTDSWTDHASGGGMLKIDTVDLWGNGSASTVFYDDLLIDPLPAVGPCCFDDGGCQEDVDPGDCDAAGGTFQGFGTACAAVDCPVLGPDGWIVDAPLTWMGDTCDEPSGCPISSSGDVRWEITTPYDADWTFSVCGAAWDTTLSLGSSPCDDDIAFNDDACGLASEIEVTLEQGTYFLTLEGLGGSECGAFTLQVSGFCILDTTGTPEGEPDCGPGYVDTFNGGCNSDPDVFSDIECGDLIAGKYGNFDDARDTDWYRIQLTTGTTLNWSVTGEGPSLAGIIDLTAPGACDDPDLGFEVADTADTCETAEVSLAVGPGTYVLFAAPSGFDLGIPCGSDYQGELTCGAGKPCPEDLDSSGTVGFTDLLAILNAWGPCPGCPEDLDSSGVVGFTDLLAVLNAWGPCP